MLDLNLIRLDSETQSRVALNNDVVSEYAEAYRSGASMPAIIVFFDGSHYWLADGYHRYHGAKEAGLTQIFEEIHPGTKRDAVLYSAGANASHGLRRLNEDKRRAVEILLQDEEWRARGIRWIARQCAVSEGFVHKLYHRTAPVHNEQIESTTSVHNEQIEKPDIRIVERNGKTYQQDTTNIGKRQSDVPVQPAEEQEPSCDRSQDKAAEPNAEATENQQDQPKTLSKPKTDELEVLKEENARLRNQLAEAMDNCEALADDNKAMQLSANPESVKKFQELQQYISVLESQRNEFQNKCAELTKEVKRLRRQLEKVNG